MIKHPAKYSEGLLNYFYDILKDFDNVLDPFAGTCKIKKIKDLGFKGKIYCNEIESEWAEQGRGFVDYITTVDAEFLPYEDNFFDAICTSPTYGNRMADHHKAKDNSKRNTYTHTIGRDLNIENTGKMQWGTNYKEKHERIWMECKRILKCNAIFVLNISDHIKKGQIINVTEWHIKTLEKLGFTLVDHLKVKTHRLRQGANSNLRVDYESICVFILKK
jgi:tRNA G10  N-methylase Trm11